VAHSSEYGAPASLVSNLALVALVALAGCATTSGVEKVGPVIDNVRLLGTKQLGASDVKKRILTGASSFQGVPVLEELQRYDPNSWQADLRRIERYYQARGYYQARVVSEQVVDTPGGTSSCAPRWRKASPRSSRESS